MAPKFFVGGNWKMNGNKESILSIVEFLKKDLDNQVEVVVGVPSVYLSYALSVLPSNVKCSAQNCYKVPSGAFTGEVSPAMLKDIGVEYVILGHSERRNVFGETDELVAEKVEHAVSSGLYVIACIGEKLDERESGKTRDVVIRQLTAITQKLKSPDQDYKSIVIAYEPVWAIGTGKTATPEQAQEVHEQIRSYLKENLGEQVAAETRIIYGGSVTSDNCRELAKKGDINGFLVGGASLKPGFVDIVNANK